MKKSTTLIGAALLSAATTLCAQSLEPYNPTLPQAPSTTATLSQMLENITRNLDTVNEENYLYNPLTGVLYNVTMKNSRYRVETDPAIYSNICWENNELYNIHTHPVLTMRKNPFTWLFSKIRKVFSKRNRWECDTQECVLFNRYNPSPVADLEALTTRTIEFYRRQPGGSIRFFIATRDDSGQAILIEYGLTGEKKELLEEVASQPLPSTNKEYECQTNMALNRVVHDYNWVLWDYLLDGHKSGRIPRSETWREANNTSESGIILRRYCSGDLPQ